MRLLSHDEHQLPGSSQPGKEQIIESQNSSQPASKVQQWILMAFCLLLLACWIVQQLVHDRPDYAAIFSPNLIPLAGAILATAGVIQVNFNTRWIRLQGIFRWSSLLLMVWTANGLPFDLLRLTPLMPPGVDWPGMVTRAVALVIVIMLARLVLARQDRLVSAHIPKWYGYAAFVIALPYPVLRTWWAFGGTPGIMWKGAAGIGFGPWLACIPWLLAAVLSLLLVPENSWIPRRILLVAGWTATAIVAMIGPAACWVIVSKIVAGDLATSGPPGMAAWVPCLFYSSWFLWAIAGGAATRSYQLRSASTPPAAARLSP